VSKFLYRLGRGSASHRRLVVVAWLVVVVALLVFGKVAGSGFHDAFNVPGTESQTATDMLKSTFRAQSGGTAQVVFHARSGTLHDPASADAIAQTMRRIARLPHVAGAPDPLTTGSVSKDGTIALATVQYDEASNNLPKSTFSDLEAATKPATAAGLQVEFGGQIPQAGTRASLSSSELFGILAAIVILLFAFGSLIAMGLPIGTALFGLGAGIALISFISAFVDMPSTSTAIASMIGLGVGIDYSLFIVTRHRSELHQGLAVEDAVGRAIATAGQAVMVAGGTVVIAICGLAVAGVPLVTFMGVGAAIVVAVMVVAALTLLPALIGFAGHNIDRFGIPGTQVRHEAGVKDEHGRYRGFARWSHHVSRHPVVYLLASLGVILVLAAPMLSLRLGQPDASTDPTSSTLRRSYDLLAEGFGPGFNGPLILAVDLENAAGDTVLAQISTAVKSDPDVAVVAAPVVGPNGDTAVIQVTPKSAPQNAATSDLVQRLRSHLLPSATAGTDASAYVGGPTATFIDLSDRIAERLPWFIGLVVLLSFLLLMIVFRSILVPLKAALMNLLSIGAAYGVMVAVFQKGWGASLFGVHESLPIVSFVPMFMFAILFGLSMDYEVFLLSRIREEYHRTKNNTEAVVAGITTTGRVITSAALIMISVFLSFVFGAEPTIKMIGLGLATAVFVDATIIRMVLVPATMQLLGDANWWLPRWLDRIIPKLDIEGGTGLPPAQPEDEFGISSTEPVEPAPQTV
jgi:RND superfamily putative drug exporter